MGLLRALRLVLPIAICFLCNAQNPFNADYYIPMENKTGGGGNVGLQDVNGGPTVVQGVVGNALHYQGSQASKMGTDTRSNCFEDIHKCPDGFTVAVWLKFGSVVSDQILDTGGYHGGSRGWSIVAKASGWVNTFIRMTGGGLKASSHCKTFIVNNWTHVALRYNHTLGNLALFINGQRINETSSRYYLYVGDSHPQPYIGQTTFGDVNGNNDFYVDELMHWDRPISDALIERVAKRLSYKNGNEMQHARFILSRPCTSPTAAVIDIVTVRSKLQCVAHCAEVLCKAYYYHPQNGSCIAHTTRMPLWEMSDPSWMFYELK